MHLFGAGGGALRQQRCPYPFGLGGRYLPLGTAIFARVETVSGTPTTTGAGGTDVVICGGGNGTATGTIRIGGVLQNVVSWTPNRIRITLTGAPQTGVVTVTPAGAVGTVTGSSFRIT